MGTFTRIITKIEKVILELKIIKELVEEIREVMRNKYYESSDAKLNQIKRILKQE